MEDPTMRIVSRAAADYGLDAKVESMRIGWITPLKITGLSVIGESESSVLEVGRIDTELTVMDLIGTLPEKFGEISLRDVKLACAMNEGRCSLESDLAALLESPDESGGSLQTSIKLQDVAVEVTDQVTGEVWQADDQSEDPFGSPPLLGEPALDELSIEVGIYLRNTARDVAAGPIATRQMEAQAFLAGLLALPGCGGEKPAPPAADRGATIETSDPSDLPFPEVAEVPFDIDERG